MRARDHFQESPGPGRDHRCCVRDLLDLYESEWNQLDARDQMAPGDLRDLRTCGTGQTSALGKGDRGLASAPGESRGARARISGMAGKPLVQGAGPLFLANSNAREDSAA